MAFRIDEHFFDSDDEFLFEKAEAYREELIKRFVASPEGKAVLEDGEADWAELFVDIVVFNMGMQINFVVAEIMREILYDYIPYKVVAAPEDAESIVQELKAFWEYLKREFNLWTADSCLRVLNQKTLISRLQAALKNPDNFSPSKTIATQLIAGGVNLEDQEAVQKYIDAYNAKIQAAMQPPKVTEKTQAQHKTVKKLIEQVCKAHLNKDYAKLSLKLLDKMLFQYPDVLERGQAKSWAAGIVYAIGRVNFLFDPSQQPHLTAAQLSAAFEISQNTASAKSAQLFDLFELMQFHPEWTLPSMIESNPLVWMITVNGLLMDARHAPRDVQVMAYNQGLIPYIPADKKGK
jgi:hypothetical protein